MLHILPQLLNSLAINKLTGNVLQKVLFVIIIVLMSKCKHIGEMEHGKTSNELYLLNHIVFR
jgi:hypothetical protein